MNIERAAEVLNERRHINYSWRIYRGRETVAEAFIPDDEEDWDGLPFLTAFEAIAVAEAYERQAGRDMPATRKMMQVYRGFAREMSDCLMDGDCIMRNSEGGLTFGEIRAALAEWEAKP